MRRSQRTTTRWLAQMGLLFLSLFLWPQPYLAQMTTSGESIYQQKGRSVHTPADFLRMTKGKVKLLRSPVQPSANGEIVIGTESGILLERRRAGRVEQVPMPGFMQPGLDEFTVLAQSEWSGLLVGTQRGALIANVLSPGRPVYQYLIGSRWLPDDHVTGIGVEGHGQIVWIETPKGFSRIEFKSMTLDEKSAAFVERVQKRHVRHSLTADSILTTPGDLTTNRTVSSDNDGLWTQMYIAAEAFRYKVTGAADARANAKQGFKAMLRLESITGIPGFPARSFIKVGEDIQPKDGEWHDTPDRQWRWKGDTSSDEIVGHYFGFAVYYDLVADEREKTQIRGVVGRITDHILNHNYQLVDLDGKPTRWGWWGPDAIWEDPDETGLRALHLLSHLKVAHHITGNARYERAYRELIDKHRYHLLTRNQKINIPGHVNHSDDELAFLSYYPLLNYETDAKLHAIYAESLERAWQIERPERNPLWNFIYAAGTQAKEFDRAESLRTLQEIPMDQITWSVTNSQRLDVPRDTLADRFGKPQALIVLPYDELPVWKWNANPYRLDGGDGGRSEGDGVYFLLPYWLGRYHKLI